jgi:hypothetical protein
VSGTECKRLFLYWVAVYNYCFLSKKTELTIANDLVTMSN